MFGVETVWQDWPAQLAGSSEMNPVAEPIVVAWEVVVDHLVRLPFVILIGVSEYVFV